MKTTNKTPTAKLLGCYWDSLEVKRNSFWRIRVRCPFCGEVHLHGGGGDPAGPMMGDRRADCGGGNYDVGTEQWRNRTIITL